MKIDETILKDLSEVKEALRLLQKTSPKEIVWLDSADVKRRLQISDSTLWRYRKDGKIPFTKFGNKILYPETYFTKSLMKKIENSHLL